MRSVQDGTHRGVLDLRRLIGSGDELGYNGIDGGHGVNGEGGRESGKINAVNNAWPSDRLYTRASGADN